MTKEEIAKAQEAITELLYVEANNRVSKLGNSLVLAEKCRFTRAFIFRMLENMNYRVFINDIDDVHIFREKG